MPRSKRSGLVPALLAASTLCGVAAASPASAAPPLTVLGDSYSIPVHDGTRDWPAQLRDRGAVGPVHDFAKSGAIAATIGANTFARQVRLWTAAGRPRGDTVVYLGYNDIDGRQSLAPSQAGYRAGVDALVRGGATSPGNRLFLVLSHDVGGTPLHNRSATERTFYRDRTRQWDGFVRSVAAGAHATVIDVFSRIDGVLADPGAAGFTNVTTADRARSGTTALYRDLFHFGLHGETILAETIGARLR
jgi:GDSL-like Lipase/Acylhydrolase family